MHVISSFFIREVAGERIAVPAGAAAAKFSGIISLNESAAFLLAALSDEQTEESLLAAMLEEFDTDAATARADIADFLASLRTLGLLEGADA